MGAPGRVGARWMTALIWRSVARRWMRASASADSTSRRGSVAARSQIVRAGVVSGMPSLDGHLLLGEPSDAVDAKALLARRGFGLQP